MAIADLSIVPVGTGSTSLSPWVADLQRLLARAPEPIRYEMTAMGTLIEGSMPDLLAVIGRLHEAPFAAGADRVYTVVKFDDRRDRPSTLESKVSSVRTKLG
ncbi:MAG TPA: MTH1187 family thiamine-binding protein [Spirochaetia bacterium]|nr:MTH1187 family thiamine-binding protein [Spirochaetia bacterium]